MAEPAPKSCETCQNYQSRSPSNSGPWYCSHYGHAVSDPVKIGKDCSTYYPIKKSA